jgi:type IV pilus assembly protein PilB
MTEEAGELGSLLLDEGLIEDAQLQEAAVAAEKKGQSLGRYMVDSQIISERDLVTALAHSIGFEFVDIAQTTVDPAAAALFPDTLSRRYGAIPYSFEDDKLLVALTDPGNVLAIDDIRAVTGYDLDVRVGLKDDIMEALRKQGGLDDSVTDFVSGDDILETEDLAAVEQASEDAPVVKLVNMLITKAQSDRASDIHIEPNERDLRIRYRIDGVLHEVMRTPRNIHAAVVSRLKIMADIDIAERRRPQDGRISVRTSTGSIDLRVSSLPTIYGEKIVMRILDNSTAMMALTDLGFEEDTLERYESAYSRPYGTILVTGPTGSGKSTTLYATLNVRNTEDVNIVTVEDPVEYRLDGISQVQVNPKAGLYFANALRSFLRQDPDIMLVGEVRDLETANIAIESALTGHLVLSTLHTNDAPSSITRLTEMGVEPFMVGSAIDAILAQRLARRLCSRCKVPMDIDKAALLDAGWPEDQMDSVKPGDLFKSEGCSYCSNTGYRGRLAIHELMLVSEEIERMTVSRATADDIKKVAVAEGMRPLRQDGLMKVSRGLTSIEEILRVTV